MKSQNIEFKEKIWKFPRKKLLEVMYKEKKNHTGLKIPH